MTTPAININIPDYANCTETNVGTGISNTWSVCNGLIVQNRPASVKNTRVDGVLPCGAYHHVRRSYTLGTGSLRFQTSTHTFQRTGAVWEFTDFPYFPGTSSNLYNRLLTRALNKVKAQNIHVGTFLAEGMRTSRMIGDTARKIAEQVVRFRSSNPKQIWQAIVTPQYYRNAINNGIRRRVVPSSWLELQYGWRPLLSDVDGAMKHLAERQNERFGFPQVSVRTKGKEVQNMACSITARPGIVSVTGNCRLDTEAKFYLTYALTDPALAELSSLGLINPLEIAWELVPYSFVVDWFLPIGDWMSALSAPAGYQFVRGGTTYMQRMVFAESKVEAAPGITILSMTPPTIRMRGQCFRMQRSCFTSSPVPGLYVKNPYSHLHLANGIALLAQAFR